uniref:Uncharacterized protein n=1 Tax=Haptolina ericina TaxID=156174 RepID=A0A7S3FIT7_9EUKA
MTDVHTVPRHVTGIVALPCGGGSRSARSGGAASCGAGSGGAASGGAALGGAASGGAASGGARSPELRFRVVNPLAYFAREYDPTDVRHQLRIGFTSEADLLLLIGRILPHIRTLARETVAPTRE